MTKKHGLFCKTPRAFRSIRGFLQRIITGLHAGHNALKPEQPGASGQSQKFLMLGSLLFLLTELGPLCSPSNVEQGFDTGKLEHELQLREFESFVNTAKNNSWYSSSKNKLLLNLDSGTAEIFNGEFSSGAKKLIKVGEMSEEFYTKSVSKNILSVLTNDNTLPYYGEDYELSFAGNMTAIAFAASGNLEDALVEARRSEHRLQVMSAAYEGKKKYKDDAFSHFLAGMLFEAEGNYNDAVVSYKHAYNAYGNRFFQMRPGYLTRALIGASVAGRIDPGFGFYSLADSLVKTDLEISLRSDPGSSADYIRNSMIFVAFTGRGPKKVEHVMKAHFTDEGLDYIVKISIPEMVSRRSSIAGVRLGIDGGEKYDMELAADYNHIGVNTFKDKRGFIYAKTVARVSARYLILKKTKEKAVEKLEEKYDKAVEKHGKKSVEARTARLKIKAASAAIDLLANELLEHADTRCSLALPGSAYITRIPVLPDSHSVKVEYLDRSGRVLDTEERSFLFAPENGFVGVFTALF